MSGPLLPVAILAGGLATRLHPATERLPKCLLDVNGEPFAFHLLRMLRAKGIGRAVFCLGHFGEQVVRAVGDGRAFGMRVDHVFDGSTLLGTGGAIVHALPQLPEAFFVTYGDAYLDCDYAAIQRHFLAAGTAGLMVVYRNEGRWDTSNVELRDGRIVAHDKVARTPRMHHIDYGLGMFRREALAALDEPRPLDLVQVYRRLLERGELAAFEVTTRFYEIGSPEGLEETRRHLAALEASA